MRSLLRLSTLWMILSAPAFAAQRSPEARVDTGDVGGASAARGPRFSASESSLYAVWQDERNAGAFGPTDVLFNRSTDGGGTWLPDPIRLDTGSAPGSAVSVDVDLATSGTALYVVYTDGRNGSGDIYLNRSLDEGATWLPSDLRVNRNPAGSNAMRPRVAAAGDSVYVAWEDDRNSIPLYGTTDIYLNRSLDGGLTWFASDVRIDRGKRPGVANSQAVQLAAQGDTVFAVWQDARNGSAFGPEDIFFNRSIDGGLTWLPGSRRLDRGSAPGAASSVRPQMVVRGSSVHVVWSDRRNGFDDIYYNRSEDGGLGWLGQDLRLDLGSGAGSAISRDPHLAVEGDSVYVAWHDLRNGQLASDIYLNRSLDGGRSWDASDRRLDLGDAPGAADSSDVRLAVAGASVFAAWIDERNGLTDIYLNRSLDRGASWLLTDRRLDVGSAPGSSASRGLELVAQGPSVLALFEDQRNGAEDLYASLALGYLTYGTGSPGAGGVVPELRGGGTPSVGSVARIDVRGGRPGARCALVYSFDGRAALAAPYGTLLLAQPWRWLELRLGEAADRAGTGAAQAPLAIPDDLELLGLRANLQAAVFDPGAAVGIALSNGLELWIL